MDIWAPDGGYIGACVLTCVLVGEEQEEEKEEGRSGRTEEI